GSHADATAYLVAETAGLAALSIDTRTGPTTLADSSQFVGYAELDDRAVILLANNGLHAELVINRTTAVGQAHPAGLADVVIESAISTIEDCEDSVAAVDAEDKVGVYRNWLGLMTGTLEDTFEKGGETVTRRLNPDKRFIGTDGREIVLKGRALLLVRNVGHLTATDAVLDAEGQPIGEGLMDAAVTTLCAMHDLKRRANSATGSIYIVKPKMHGPTEVLFACNVFGAVEKFLGLPANTIKI